MAKAPRASRRIIDETVGKPVAPTGIQLSAAGLRELNRMRAGEVQPWFIEPVRQELLGCGAIELVWVDNLCRGERITARGLTMLTEAGL